MRLLKLSSITRKRQSKQSSVDTAVPLVSSSKLEPLALNLSYDNPVQSSFLSFSTFSTLPETPTNTTASSAFNLTTTLSAGASGLFDDIFSELNTRPKAQDDLQTDLSLSFALSMQLEQETINPAPSPTRVPADIAADKKTISLFDSDRDYSRSTSAFASLMKPVDNTFSLNSASTTHITRDTKNLYLGSAVVPSTVYTVLDSDVSDSDDVKSSNCSSDDDDSNPLAGQRMIKGAQPILERRRRNHHLLVQRKVDTWAGRVDPNANVIEQNLNMMERMRDRHRQQRNMFVVWQQQQSPCTLSSGAIVSYSRASETMGHGNPDYFTASPIDTNVAPSAADPSAVATLSIALPMSYTPAQSSFHPQTVYPAPQLGNVTPSPPPDPAVAPSQWEQTAKFATVPVTRPKPLQPVSNAIYEVRTAEHTQNAPERSKGQRSSVVVSAHAPASAHTPIKSRNKPVKSSRRSNTNMGAGEDDADDEEDSDNDVVLYVGQAKKKEQIRQSYPVSNLKKSKPASNNRDGTVQTHCALRVSPPMGSITPQPADWHQLKHASSAPDIPKQRQTHSASQRQPDPAGQRVQRRNHKFQGQWDRLQAYQREQQLNYAPNHYTTYRQQPGSLPVYGTKAALITPSFKDHLHPN